ncbi:type II secretion system protein [Caenispirillum bisanense]|uniref:type II secretion system protein n=1 Tax=Caenispirillum bisanense TaxID=414052 RepID=UPI0031D7AFE7
MRHSRTASRQRGFTLIEMSIVLIIFGILVGGGLLAMNPLLDRTRVRQTQANMDQIEDALLLYVMRFQRLPCPADASQAANAGQEARNAGGCNIGNADNGVIPWVTLGLPDTVSLDGWNRRFSYFVATPAANALQRVGNVFPEYNNAAGGLEVRNGANLATPDTDRAAYVLVSHGKNGEGAFPVGSTSRVGDRSAPEGDNTDSSNLFREDAGDDIVRWRQPSFLVHRCGAPCAP